LGEHGAAAAVEDAHYDQPLTRRGW